MTETDLDDDFTFDIQSRGLSEDDAESAVSDDTSSSYHPALAEQPSNAEHAATSPPDMATTSTSTVSIRNEQKLDSSDCSLKPRLNLLDLPMDILKEIFKEITHTNDLTSLALTCSTLYSLAIPHMYSRFDIVWPETMAASEHPTGVDALSYGLATLVMGEHVFRETPVRSSWVTTRSCCTHCGCNNRDHQTVPAPSHVSPPMNFRFGNYYAQYTRKFSVGNGPSMWVQEYSITKETGKMLGTLVALAVARMISLETFTWDMPTGVMRDVFIALASLTDRPGHDCRLERVWVRWHDNSDNRNIIPLPTIPSQGNASSVLSLLQRYGNVEYPTFSVLPPLKSVSVLDIDEPAYLEEMEVLIERSRHKLRELRLGIASQCSDANWVLPVESISAVSQTPPRRLTPGWPRQGGVLSILLNTNDSLSSYASGRKAVDKGHGSEATPLSASAQEGSVSNSQPLSAATQAIGNLTLDERPEPGSSSTPSDVPSYITEQAESKSQSVSTPVLEKTPSGSCEPIKSATKLKLEVLELERVHIHTLVLSKALDWSLLTTLTLLHCEDHEQLWRALRRQFSPPSLSSNGATTKRGSGIADIYPLKLKHLHTDRVSPYLMLFLKEAIKPNSLESVFFQEDNLYESIVGIDAIYKHVLRRHRASLKKVLIDRSRRWEINPSSSVGRHWRNWMLPRAALSFVTSGRMPQLKELGIGMDHRDWHFFLQRLPMIPHLRALYLPNIYDPTLADEKKHRELALQILDIVTLRPEIKLCYIGIESKCFEILESSSYKEKKDRGSDADYISWSAGSEADSNGGDGNDNHDHDNDSSSDTGEETASTDGDDDYSDEDEQNGIGDGESDMAFKLREILFYDDKISIFKARHCRL